jgi:hypothetical protein
MKRALLDSVPEFNNRCPVRVVSDVRALSYGVGIHFEYSWAPAENRLHEEWAKITLIGEARLTALTGTVRQRPSLQSSPTSRWLVQEQHDVVGDCWCGSPDRLREAATQAE